MKAKKIAITVASLLMFAAIPCTTVFAEETNDIEAITIVDDDTPPNDNEPAINIVAYDDTTLQANSDTQDISSEEIDIEEVSDIPTEAYGSVVEQTDAAEPEETTTITTVIEYTETTTSNEQEPENTTSVETEDTATETETTTENIETTEPEETTTTEPAETTIIETTPDGTFTIESLCSMAMMDYEIKHGIQPVSCDWTDLGEDRIMIKIYAENEKLLDVYFVDAKTGYGTSDTSDLICLPQTGINSTGTLTAIAIALAMTATGTTMVICSRKKKDEN